MVDVYDIFITGPQKWVIGMIGGLKGWWSIKVTGILGYPALKGTKAKTDKDIEFVEMLNFLGLTIQYVEKRLVVHQIFYIASKLERRGMRTGIGKKYLPLPSEGNTILRNMMNTIRNSFETHRCSR